MYSESTDPSRIVVKEEIEMSFENNEEAGPSRIVVNDKLERDKVAGKIMCLWIYNSLVYFTI